MLDSDKILFGYRICFNFCGVKPSWIALFFLHFFLHFIFADHSFFCVCSLLTVSATEEGTTFSDLSSCHLGTKHDWTDTLKLPINIPVWRNNPAAAHTWPYNSLLSLDFTCVASMKLTSWSKFLWDETFVDGRWSVKTTKFNPAIPKSIWYVWMYLHMHSLMFLVVFVMLSCSCWNPEKLCCAYCANPVVWVCIRYVAATRYDGHAE